MNKNAFWAACIANSVAFICWTVIAVVFDKWWLMLFSLLFFTSTKAEIRGNRYKVCDGCGKHGPVAETSEEAELKAVKAGWVVNVGDNKNLDFCPECKVKGGVSE